MFNIIGFKPKFHVLVASTQPSLLSSSQVPLWSASSGAKFPRVRVEFLMQAHLPLQLAGMAYRPAPCAGLGAELSAETQDLVKAVAPPRHKLACSIKHLEQGAG